MQQALLLTFNLNGQSLYVCQSSSRHLQARVMFLLRQAYGRNIAQFINSWIQLSAVNYVALYKFFCAYFTYPFISYFNPIDKIKRNGPPNVWWKEYRFSLNKGSLLTGQKPTKKWKEYLSTLIISLSHWLQKITLC